MTESKQEIKNMCHWKDCNKKATWECRGESARFGVPLATYYCDEHKPLVRNRPKIMAYNNHPMTWKKLEEEE